MLIWLQLIRLKINLLLLIRVFHIKKGSFVIVCEFSFDNELTIVPTLQEAYDYIEMEEIERQLNI